MGGVISRSIIVEPFVEPVDKKNPSSKPPTEGTSQQQQKQQKQPSPPQSSVSKQAKKINRVKSNEIDSVWERPEEECLLLGLPTEWSSITKILSRTVTNRRELRDLLCNFNCEEFSAEGAVDALGTALSATELDRFYGEVLQSLIRWTRGLPAAIRSFQCKPAEPRSFSLLSGTERTVSMSRALVRSVLAASFFCLFSTPRDTRFSTINFEPLFANSSAPHERSKFIALLNYFKRVSSEKPRGYISFKRLVLSKHPSWSTDQHLIPQITVVEEGSIIDDASALRVVFGCKSVGGGVLIGGSWQEEGVFASLPEMLLACLITETLSENEALLITGAERYSRMHGCAYHMTFAADWKDESPREVDGSMKNCFVLMDAADYRDTGTLSQFLLPNIARDAGKAFCAFKTRPDLPLATGAWGCGSHLGDPRLKFLIQIIAAAAAGVSVVHYFTFSDATLAAEQRAIARRLQDHSITVSDIWGALCQYSSIVEEILKTSGPSREPPDFLPFIIKQLLDDK